MLLLNMPFRKVVKCIRNKINLQKKERAPSCLTQCLLKDATDNNLSDQRGFTIPLILFTTLIIIIVPYLLYQYITVLHHYPETVITTNHSNGRIKNLQFCHINVSDSDNVIIKKPINADELDVIYPDIKDGGYYSPRECQSKNKVAILVPYRGRAMHLSIFLYNIHPFLIKQKLEYRIFVVEQTGLEAFNRGKLLNAGFKEMMKFGDFNCVIFHDVDLLPLKENILYTCPIWPRNMCADIIDEKNPKFRTLFGGVSALDVKHFINVNGYSNNYWGWGAEDNDLFRRLQYSGYPVVKYETNIGRYTSLSHPKQRHNPHRFHLLKNAIERYKQEGLTTLVYKLLSINVHHLYTHLLVDVNPNKEIVK